MNQLPTHSSPSSEAFQSLTYISQGLALATQKGMRAYIIVPILVNIILFSLMTYFILSQLGTWLEGVAFAVTLPSWLSWFQPAVDFLLGATETLLWILTIITLILFTGTTFTAITHIIGAPFHGYLAEKAEAQYRTIQYPHHSIPKLIGRTLLREITKLSYWLTRLIMVFFLTLILSLIPIINLISPAIWFAFGGWMMAIQYMDFAADNNGLDFSETLRRLKQHRLLVLGFGMAVMGLTLLPLVNLVIVPVAICGATIAWVKVLDPRAEPA